MGRHRLALATGAEAAADINDVQSPETYIGYDRAENFVSHGGGVQDAPKTYAAAMSRLNEWGLAGNWTVGAERATLNEKDGSILYRVDARDRHPVLGPLPGGKPVQFRVTIDGAAPGMYHGVDVNTDGADVVTGERLYQPVRQRGAIAERTFQVQFLDRGVAA
jgi:thioredoxin family protein